MDNIENNITITINENDEPIRSGHSGRSGNNSGRSGLLFSTKLFWLWNLLFELITGIAFIYFMSLFHDDGSAVIICGLIFVCVHTAASAALFKQHYCKNCIPAWKFVLLNALPLFLIGVFIYAVDGLMSEVFCVFGLDLTMALWFFSVSSFLYSVVYGVLLTAALGIGHLIERKRS